MSIIIGADIVPTKENIPLFNRGDISALIGTELKQILDNTDFRVFNLETPLTDNVTPINKCGPALSADTSTIKGLGKLGVNLFTLANNHIMDQGELGLRSTWGLLKKKGIHHLGSGENLAQASRPFIVNINGNTVGFYACVEHEFSIAGNDSPGANPFDVLESFNHIVELKRNCDYVIVLYHGGKELYQYPSPMLQRACRKFIQVGADIVICQHSHCIGCEEKFGGGTIVYGQGNFIFSECDSPLEQSSLLIKLTDSMSIEYIPLVKTNNGVRLATGEKAQTILQNFKKRSKDIVQDGFVEDEYKKFATMMLNDYMLTCSGYNHKIIHHILDKLTLRFFSKFIKRVKYRQSELLAIRNYIECEAHRELWLEGLKNVKR